MGLSIININRRIEFQVELYVERRISRRTDIILRYLRCRNPMMPLLAALGPSII